MASNPLEQAAIQQRKQLLTNNYYNNFDINNNYSPTHTRAKSDDQTPIHGKGTGVPFDSENGGGYWDIYGHPNFAGSGRIGNLVTNDFNPDNPYRHPDTSGNEGQVTIE